MYTYHVHSRIHMHAHVHMCAHIHATTSYRTMHIWTQLQMGDYLQSAETKRKWKMTCSTSRTIESGELNLRSVLQFHTPTYIQHMYTTHTYLINQMGHNALCFICINIFHLRMYTQSINEDPNNMVKSGPLSTCTVGTHLHNLQSITKGV